MKKFIIRPLSIVLIILMFNGCKEEESNPCESTNIVVEILTSTPPSSCNAEDVSVTFDVTGGSGAYRYFLNTGSTTLTQNNSTFTGLFPGRMNITVRDGNNCTASLEFEILSETSSGVGYMNDIKPILDANCNLATCHNGDLGADRDWRSVSTIQNKLNNFQRVLSLNKMPPPPNQLLSNQEKSAILCWIADGGLDN